MANRTDSWNEAHWRTIHFGHSKPGQHSTVQTSAQHRPNISTANSNSTTKQISIWGRRTHAGDFTDHYPAEPWCTTIVHFHTVGVRVPADEDAAVTVSHVAKGAVHLHRRPTTVELD
jgi:hypothetical protein